MNAEQAIEYIDQVLLCPGPLDMDPDEFAGDWVSGASKKELADILDAALDPAAYIPGIHGQAWGWVAIETILDCWAAYDAKGLVEDCLRILNHPVGRFAALFALEAAVRYDKSRTSEVKEALQNLVPPFSESEQVAVCRVLYHLDKDFNAAISRSLDLPCQE